MRAAVRRTRVLLVDDDPGILTVVGRRLERWGYDVLTAATGETGLRLARTQRPDLILLDALVPPLNGAQVGVCLTTDPKTRRIPVIFLTALGSFDHLGDGLVMGAADCLVKPFDAKQLRTRIEAALARTGGAGPRHRALGTPQGGRHGDGSSGQVAA